MNKKEFDTLEIGEVVIITIPGKNFGKQGTVESICQNRYNSGGKWIYLRPINCIFEFNKTVKSVRTRDDGTSRFGHAAISYLNKPIIKGTIQIESCFEKELVIPIVKKTLEIYRFNLHDGVFNDRYMSAISTNEEDARKALHSEILKYYYAEKELTITLKDILPIINGICI